MKKPFMLCDDTKIIHFFILKSIDKKMKSIQITFIIYFRLDPYSAGKGYVNEVLSLTLLKSFALIIRLYR